MPQPELMDQQPELRWHMRPFLIDFIVEIHQQIHLRPEVLYLAVNIVDRYVSRRVVYKKHYQLVGVAALWIAAKFEDFKDRVPQVRELYDMCCSAYEQAAFIQMEGHILTTIGWNCNHPTAEGWLRSYLADCSPSEHPMVQHTSRLLMEITTFHKAFVGVRPSVIAWGSLILARSIHNQPRQTPPSFMSRRDDEEAVRVAEAIDNVFAEHRDEVSDIVMRKYSINHFHRCSQHVHYYYRAGGRYVSMPPPPPPALTPSTPTSGSDVDEEEPEPLTPITPIDDEVAAAHRAMACKENKAPHDMSANLAKHNHMAPLAQRRPALNALPGSSLTIPQAPRALRRLSN